VGNQETTVIVTELETKIAFLEAANDELERALLLQHERIDRIDIIVNELRNRVAPATLLKKNKNKQKQRDK